ncbi:MAG TPA: winged helix-turn-helix transcriptional regulator [Dehalococcoidia bacterium]|nr:winged helix-turn-helix transcriptional regulator [Dehalococcoidia bacterium]
MADWTFLTNHARVLSFIAKHSSITALELSNSIGIAERATRKIIADLEACGYISKRKVVRRNTKWDFTQYLNELTQTEVSEYFRPNFWTNTPDILTAYLQTGGRPAFMVRLVLAACIAPIAM